MINREDFDIVPSAVPAHADKWFRARDKVTGEESALGSREECERVIDHAVKGELLGSFCLRSSKAFARVEHKAR